MKCFFKKNCLCVLLAGMMVASSAQAFNWSSLRSLNLSALVATISKNSKAATIMGLGTAGAVVIGAVVVRSYRRATRLPRLICEDPESYIQGVENRLQNLEAVSVEQLATEIEPLTKMKEEIVSIMARSDANFYSSLSDTYKANAEPARRGKWLAYVSLYNFINTYVRRRPSEVMLNRYGTNIPEFLDIPRTASFDEFNQALESKKRLFAYNDDALWTLRQIGFISRARFGYENYCAYLRGKSAVKALPCVDPQRCFDAQVRAVRLINNYDQYTRGEFAPQAD